MSEVNEIIRQMQEEENSPLYKAKRQFLISLAIFAVGCGVTIGTFFLPTDTFWVAWGAILFGGLCLLYNSIKLLWLSRHGGAGPWPLFVGVTLLAMFGSMGFAGYYLIASSPPDDSFVALIEETPTLDGGTIRFRGEVKNNHDEWTIKDVKVQLYLPFRDIPPMAVVVPAVIGPGEAGLFALNVARPRAQSGSDQYHYEAMWEWVKP